METLLCIGLPLIVVAYYVGAEAYRKKFRNELHVNLLKDLNRFTTSLEKSQSEDEKLKLQGVVEYLEAMTESFD